MFRLMGLASWMLSYRWWIARIATAVFALFFMIGCWPSRAQSGAGSIEGTVTDVTGAVIPGASIHVRNKNTGVSVNTVSNSIGFYQVPGLLTGTYEVSITSPGMKTSTETIDLLVAQNAVINARLSAGAVTQQVTVSANTVELTDTTSGTISSTLEYARINQLPMNGRNLLTLVNETTPGLESCPESSSCANGLEGPSTEFVVDGASLANREFGGAHLGAAQMVDPDSVQEVRVEDTSAGAQYSEPTTAILQTKSGTNRLHGSLFETARNNAFGIARTREDQSNFAAPKYIRNEFGASMGGPIVIPHLYNGKNKSFFFLSYERYSLAQVVSQNEYAPTTAMRNGDFSGLVNKSGVLQELYDPNTTQPSAKCAEPAADGTVSKSSTWCRKPFMDSTGKLNVIPLNRESPTAAVLNAMTPLPTNANNPLVASNLIGLDPELQIDPQVTFRLDQGFNENNRAYLRYTQNLDSNLGPRNDPVNASYSLAAPLPGGGSIPAGADGIKVTPSAVFAAALGYTHIFSPTFYSETILSDSWFNEWNLAGGAPNTNFEAELGLPNNFGEKGFPYVSSILQPMVSTQFQFGMNWTIPQVDENLTKISGKHQFMFGGRYRFERLGSLIAPKKDTIKFNGLATGLYNPSTGTTTPKSYANSGELDADEFIGAASSYSVNLNPPFVHLHDMEIDLYFQDSYRVRRNLTLNLGLRYEAHPAIWMGQGAMMGFDIKNDAIVTSDTLTQLEAKGLTTPAIIANDQLDGVKFETASQAGLPPMLTRNYNLNFSPRVGVAWRPFGHWGTVLRGGVGRYIYPVPIRGTYSGINKNNPFTAGYSESYLSVQYAPRNNYLLTAPQNNSSTYSYTTTLAGGGTPVMGVNTVNAVNSNSTNAILPGITLSTIDPNDPPTFVDEANFTIEQPAKWNSVVRLSYVYTHSTNLENYFYFNDQPSMFTWEVQEGAIPPNSKAFGPTNSSTGEGPYDNLTYGSGMQQIQKTGWSNYNALQAVYQKIYHNGLAWQVMYVWSKSLRTGGHNGSSQEGIYVDPYVNYMNSYVGSYVDAGGASATYVPEGGALIPPALPPPPPPGVPVWGYYKALNRWENYMVDTASPPQHLQFNGIIDLPFGKGKRWLGNSNRAMNEVVGGWQVASAGRLVWTDFAIDSGKWGPTNPLKVYKHGAPVTDCRSGVCLKGYEWFNGYIAPTALAGNACSGGLSNVVNGLPSNWAPYQTPIDTICSAPVGGHASVDQYYGTNDVVMNNVSGQPANTVIPYGVVPANNSNGPSGNAVNVTNPFGHTVLAGPMNWSADVSLFKVFPITERFSLRLNVDAFNVFNNQGLPTPGSSDGIVCVTPGGQGCSSNNIGRQLQFTARLNF